MKCPSCCAPNDDVPGVMAETLCKSCHRGVTVCTTCAAVLIYHHGALRLPTEIETSSINAHPISVFVRLIQSAIRIRTARPGDN